MESPSLAWTTEDRFMLQLLFTPEEARPFLTSGRPDVLSSGAAALDGQRLLDTARRESVAALLFRNVRKHRLQDLLPEPIHRGFSDAYHINLKRNMAIIGKLRPVLSEFRNKGISCIVLKGIALAERVYPDIAVRGMSDVDLLIRKDDLLEADRLLLSLGYDSCDSSAAEALRNPVGYLASVEYRGAKSPFHLHMHWHPVNTSVPATLIAERIDLDRLWDHAVEACVADGSVLILRPEHLVIYLCEHALRVGHSFDRLILICDLFFSIKAFEKVIDWDFIVEESRRFNLSRFVWHGLSVVRRYAPLELPDGFLAQVRPTDLSLGERLFLHLQSRNRRVRGSSYLLHLAINRGFWAKTTFLFRTFFPPKRIMLQRRYLKDVEFSKMMYLSRIGEVLSHLWRGMTTGRPGVG